MIEGPIQTNNSGLVFYFDSANAKSYVGEPTSNLIPSPTYNAYPTYGNGWATYNTNQYGSGTYFSIGTVSSVSNNIVTMSAAHSLRTYDAMQPQTSGGGLTAGNVYFIKKLSSTTFCLYPYNGSQDGSQGYINPATGNHKVYDSIMLDQKVSINATNFPTMWWGPPHYPNSGLVKEIIPGGFDVNPGNKTDCVRLHYIRPEGVLDGMSYGADASVTIGSPVTTTFWTRAVTSNAVGTTVSFQHYNYGGVSGADGFYFYPTLGPVGVWEKKSFTFTPTRNTLISYWFYGTAQAKYDIANIQIEQKGHATNFIAGSRSNTQGAIDLTGTGTIDLTNAAYDSNGGLYFNGTGFCTTTAAVLPSANSTPITLIAWCKPTNLTSWQTVLGTHGSFRQIGFNGSNFYFGGNGGGGNNFVSGGSVSNNNWYMLAMVYDGGTTGYGYLNGTLASSGNIGSNGGSNGVQCIGSYHSGGYEKFQGYISECYVYNRALTASEILKNFNARKGRYGL
jgi:hypothetical protein